MKFLLVDLLTATGLYVATVPDCWVFKGNKCYYPRSTGDARVAAMKREPFKQIGRFITVQFTKLSVSCLITICFKFALEIDFSFFVRRS